MNQIVPSPLPDLAARIRAEHAGVVATLQRSFAHAMAAGDLLLAAKAQLKHGQWLPWLADHCGISERTAQVYMRLAKNREALEAKTQSSADLTVDSALKLLAAPSPKAQRSADLAPDDFTLPKCVAQHLQNHPIADIIPIFDGPGFDILVESVREDGLSRPITLFEGKILDGRARYKACLLTGVEPRFKELSEGANPINFLYSMNVYRTHLSEDQIAIITAEMRELRRKINTQAGEALMRNERWKLDTWISAGGTEAELKAILAINHDRLTPELIVRCADARTSEKFYVALAEATNSP